MPRLLALTLLLAATSAGAAPDEGSRPFDVRLVPGKIHEECLRVEKGQKRRYHWRADGPVDFNVHHHRGDEVLYPVKRDGMRGDGGTFVAKSGDDYCWMWSARPGAPVRVRGSIEP